jgi:predicted alpha/beta-hydrolase family hydrolase
MLKLADVLSPYGGVVRFNFPYRENGSARPDPMPVLKQTILDIAERERGSKKLLIGGRSMGGRAASMLAADGFACDGLLLFAYPLHPAGRPEKLRDAHLPQIRVPVLCFNGTRDALCTRELMERAVAGLPNWRMHWLEGADHSFRVLKSSGRTEAGVYEEIAEIARSFIA